MASRPLITLLAALVSAASLRAQAPTPVRLSFANAVRQATGASPDATPPVVEIAGFRADAASARVRQARAGLLPSLSLSGSWANRNFNSKAQGISFPGVQTIFDFSNFGRVSAAKSAVTAASAERSAVVEASAQNVALAYLRGVRARAVVAAREADSSLAAELVGLAVAQQQAGVSASIDVTRARSQLADAAGRLVVAGNQLDRAKIDLARALGLDPATPIAL